MKYKDVDLKSIFAISNHIKGGKLKKIMTENGTKDVFDKLYAMHEAFGHFEPGVNEVSKIGQEKNKMNDRDFVFTALAFKNALGGIDQFIGIIGGERINYNFEDIIISSIEKNSDYSKEIDGESDFEKIYCSLGIYNKKKFERKNDKSDRWKDILIGIRNKLVHPNSMDNKVIHILGNFKLHSGGINGTHFEFKSSFVNEIDFQIKKDIFIKCLLEIQKKCLELCEYGNKCIDKLALTKIKKFIPEEKAIINKIEEHIYLSPVYHPLLKDRYGMVKLYKAGKTLNNLNIRKYAVNCIKMSNLFDSVFNFNFSESKYGLESFREYRNNYIKRNYNGPGNAHYAMEKIGYWPDEDAKRGFKSIFDAIDKDLPGKDPYPIRMLAFEISNLDGTNMLLEQEEQLRKGEKMTPEKLATYQFKNDDS